MISSVGTKARQPGPANFAFPHRLLEEGDRLVAQGAAASLGPALQALEDGLGQIAALTQSGVVATLTALVAVASRAACPAQQASASCPHSLSSKTMLSAAPARSSTTGMGPRVPSTGSPPTAS